MLVQEGRNNRLTVKYVLDGLGAFHASGPRFDRMISGIGLKRGVITSNRSSGVTDRGSSMDTDNSMDNSTDRDNSRGTDTHNNAGGVAGGIPCSSLYPEKK